LIQARQIGAGSESGEVMKTNHVTQRYVIAVVAFVIAICALANTTVCEVCGAWSCLQSQLLCDFPQHVPGGRANPAGYHQSDGLHLDIRSSASWIKVNPASSSALVAFVTITVLPNIGPSRSGSVEIEGQEINIAQNAGPCIYQFVGLSKDFSAAGASQTNFVGAVASNAACPRTAVAAQNWIKIVSGADDIGSGAIGYKVDPNIGAARSASIVLARRSFRSTNPADAHSALIGPPRSIPMAGVRATNTL
jgi:hypothetical protein